MSESPRAATGRSRVIIVGGGFAALEAALALRALAKQRAQLALVAPNATFSYHPAATVEAFTGQPPRRYDLAEIAADLGAAYRHSAVESVAAEQQWLRLESGAVLDYDRLILALGARARAAVPGALTFRDQRDLPRLRVVLDELGGDALRRLVFAVPSRDSWSLPAYELALLAAARAARQRVNVELSVVTPEPAPLAAFGAEASRLVSEILEERGIRFVGNSLPHSVRRDGALALEFDAAVEADRVIAISELRGPRLAGVPASWSGFVPVDSLGRVEGVANVYAAGDMTSYPVKQGGIAAQQADVIAHTIAAELGAPVKELRQTRVLRARLLDGEGAIVLRTELDALGRPCGASLEHRESRHAPELKVFGLYLTPYLSIHRQRLEVAV